MNIDVKIRLLDDRFKQGIWELPRYETEGSAAIDLRAAIHEPIVIPAGAAIHNSMSEPLSFLSRELDFLERFTSKRANSETRIKNARYVMYFIRNGLFIPGWNYIIFKTGRYKDLCNSNCARIPWNCIIHKYILISDFFCENWGIRNMEIVIEVHRTIWSIS